MAGMALVYLQSYKHTSIRFK